MAKKYPGLYLYFDWLKGLVKLPPEVAMQIIENLYHYAEEGREPTSLDEACYNIIQDMYLDQIKRAKHAEACGRRGGLARSANAVHVPIDPYYSDYIPEDDEIIDREITEVICRNRAKERLAQVHETALYE